MLVVQPTSTCDVCLERYAWDAPASEHLSKPHVITCGHVFCHQCLQNLRVPRTCPLCRASFHLTRAVRVHVDLATDASPEQLLSPEEAQARRFELRLAQLARTNTDDVSTAEEDEEEEQVVQEARAWLEDHGLGAPSDSHPILHALLASITSLQSLSTRIQSTQAETTRVRGERDNARRHARRAERAREQEVALARTSEKTWAVRVQEIERECETKLSEAAAERRRLEDELTNLRLALKDAHAAQSDALVQAHLQIHDQNLSSAAAAPPYSPPGRPAEVASSSQQQQHQAAGPSSTSKAASTSGIAFPRSSSPAYEPYGFSYSHNPLPRPPEPVPLSRLPAFARPRPGSSAYTAARALARHAHRLGSDKEVERRERRRERERGRKTEDEREVDRERRRRERKEREKEKEGTGTDSGTARERRQKSSRAAGKERDRGTDTSATETQDRQRARSRPRHSSLVGHDDGHEDGREKTDANAPPVSVTSLPRDVVGGWGLERSWRASASLVGSASGASAPVSREDLHEDFREAAEAVGSSHTKMRVREQKGKGKEKDAEEDREDYVFVRSTREERDHDELPRGRERERHVSFSTYPSESREPLQPQEQIQSQGRERRTTLSAAPSALGLVLVPSPDGHGGYEYQYQYPFQYRPIAAQSAIQTGSAGASASGKESITPLASMNGVRSHAQNVGYPSGGAHEMHGRASTASNATLTRRATDSHLQAQMNGYAAVPRHPRAPSTALHVPQPRRISLTIPEPDSEPSPHPERTQPQPQPHTQSFRNDMTYGYGAFTSAYGQRNAAGAGGIYSNTNPSANMSLDSALASLSLAAGNDIGQSGTGAVAASRQQQQTLRHRMSDSSATSASTGISLRGTSREKRKQLLDALFTDTDPGTGSGSVSTRSSYASKSDANRVSREIDAAGGAVKGEATAGGAQATAQQNTTASGPPPLVASARSTVAPRGVPSRDGRPSRGLSSSTRPSTIQPIQSTVEATSVQAQHNGTAYPTHIPSHARQATYPSAYGTQPTYASNTTVYQPQSNSPVATYAAYPTYYHHTQGQAQTHLTSAAPSAARFGNYGVVQASAAGAGNGAQARP